ncbi:MAG: beta-propeller domain-containing protein [Candidatus Baldrarchaeia archaeon]
MKRVTAYVLLFIIVVSITSIIITLQYKQLRDQEVRLKRFSSYTELKKFIEENLEAPYYGVYRGTDAVFLAESSEPSLPTAEYSKTNVQVEGVDEADIVKTDGKYIYVASGGNVTIVKAYPPEEAEVLSKIELNGTVTGIYVNKDRLIVFESNFPFFRAFYAYEPFYEQTYVKIYDISDRRTPILKRDISLSGWYFNSRMIDEYVYVVVNSPAIKTNEEGEIEVLLPKISINKCEKTVPASKIYYSEVPDYYYTYTIIMAINVQNDQEEPTYETILMGITSSMYVSLNNIYLVVPKWSETGTEVTIIHRIHIEGSKIKYEATGQVPGRVLNQFSMDEYRGYFRIATTTGHVARNIEEATSANHIYILDMNMSIVGKIENIAPGEKIYSARFMGNRCYLVTFKKIDPFFVIDLENPTNPKILGKLKISGYSDYLHPYDENHIIGIGKETVEAEEGDFAWYQGVKISLFDVSDVKNPKEISKYVIGDRGTETPVLYDHKALLFDKNRNLLVIPVLVAEINEEEYPEGVPPYVHGEYTWQGVYVFNISLEEGIVLRGKITHLENETISTIYYYLYSPYMVKRALYIGNILYTISDRKIKMNSLDTLEEINEIKL